MTTCLIISFNETMFPKTIEALVKEGFELVDYSSDGQEHTATLRKEDAAGRKTNTPESREPLAGLLLNGDNHPSHNRRAQHSFSSVGQDP